jgi:hypothetical protein
VERWGGEVGGVLGWSGGVLEHNPNASPGSQRVAPTLEWKVMSLLNVTAWPRYVAVKFFFDNIKIGAARALTVHGLGTYYLNTELQCSQTNKPVYI